MPTVRPALFAALALALGVAGCGQAQPKLVPLAGRVTLAGNPVAGGSLTFYPDGGTGDRGSPPSCQLQADGTFAAKTYPFGDGVPPGAYKVTLDPGLAGRLKKPQFADAAKTPWSVTVPDTGVADIVFEVK